MAQGLICQEGTGRRNAPFRYWLPGMEEKWRADPLQLRDLDELLQERAKEFGEQCRDQARRRKKGTGMETGW